MLEIDFLKRQFERNFEYVKENGYRSLEPHILYDLYFTHRAMLNPTFINKVFRKLEVKTIEYFPFLLKPYLKLQRLNLKLLTPYALGFFMQAYAKIYLLTQKSEYISEIKNVHNVFCEFLIKTEHGVGVPYSPDNKPYVLYGTTGKDKIHAPGAGECIPGYLDAFEATSDDTYLKFAKQMADACFYDFQIKRYNDKACFDYSNANDGSHVLNANILIANGLLKLADKIDYSEYDEVIKACYLYTKYYVENYDCLPYCGEEDKKRSKFWNSYDCYHTGFVLRSMYNIDKSINGGRDFDLIFAKVKKMLLVDFVYEAMVRVNIISKRRNIHAFAEYINTYATFYEFFNIDEREIIENIIEKSFKLYISKKDDRRYILKQDHFFLLDVYTVLWGQSAMMNAIASLLLKKSKTKI